MTEPKVSVSLLTYNQERFIGQAFESVLEQQTNFPFEVVVGEDCSTDDTRRIVESLARRRPDVVRILDSVQNLGAKRNFMRTFRACRGRYRCILEGDDYWTCPQKLQLQVDALDARPDWAMCFHPAVIDYADWRRPPAQWPERWDKPEATLLDLFEQDFIPTNAVMFRAGLFGDFPPWFEGVLNGDWALHFLNAEHGNIGFLPQAMSVYRVHPGGIWTSTHRRDQLASLLKLMSAIDHHFGGRYTREIDECRRHIINAAFDESESVLQELADLRARCGQLTREAAELRGRLGERWSSRIAREVVRPLRQVVEWSRGAAGVSSQRDAA